MLLLWTTSCFIIHLYWYTDFKEASQFKIHHIQLLYYQFETLYFFITSVTKDCDFNLSGKKVMCHEVKGHPLYNPAASSSLDVLFNNIHFKLKDEAGDIFASCQTL